MSSRKNTRNAAAGRPKAAAPEWGAVQELMETMAVPVNFVPALSSVVDCTNFVEDVDDGTASVLRIRRPLSTALAKKISSMYTALLERDPDLLKLEFDMSEQGALEELHDAYLLCNAPVPAAVDERLAEMRKVSKKTSIVETRTACKRDTFCESRISYGGY